MGASSIEIACERCSLRARVQVPCRYKSLGNQHGGPVHRGGMWRQNAASAGNAASARNVASGNVASECGVSRECGVREAGMWRQGMWRRNAASAKNAASGRNVASAECLQFFGCEKRSDLAFIDLPHFSHWTTSISFFVLGNVFAFAFAFGLGSSMVSFVGSSGVGSSLTVSFCSTTSLLIGASSVLVSLLTSTTSILVI